MADYQTQKLLRKQRAAGSISLICGVALNVYAFSQPTIARDEVFKIITGTAGVVVGYALRRHANKELRSFNENYRGSQ